MINFSSVFLFDSPTGPFVLDSIFHDEAPGNAQNRFSNCNQTALKDPDDKCGYHIFAGYDNGSLVISLLTPDYRRPLGRSINTTLGCEAPTFFKARGVYFMFKSACTGFGVNDNTYATADSMLGTWTEHGNFAQGVNSTNTFSSQVTEALPVQGGQKKFNV